MIEKRTCISWDNIQKELFLNQRFQKLKVDGKWYFPAKETKAFLLNWLTENEVQERKDYRLKNKSYRKVYCRGED
ncbi:hypothetical protein [Bacillus pacificus]|uniref:hypothetical protein n=1 Tax=Bacillus pacificus TaxID=2026187 RepID=UPI00156B7236|nr:hypothetical protein [Bacillus pacificus]MDA2169327.1 hypothetical protein [Bacillus cereus]NRR17602.1 hypothetical protein [Bacillus pacificus]